MGIRIGQKAPAFKLPNQDGVEVSLADHKGKNVLVYFYPKDNTPGCTKEACTLNESLPDLKALGTVILGISVDGVASHRRFHDKYGLSFDLLSDEKKEVVKKYGVWGKKKFMGREYMGTFRRSFLIGPEGKIRSLYEKVKPAEHADEVVAELKGK